MFFVLTFAIGLSCVTAANVRPFAPLPSTDQLAVMGDKSRIINGAAAVAGEFPHQMSLRRFGSHICGASIISNNFAVTAAHCVDGVVSLIFMSVAGNYLSSTNEPGSFTLGITEIIQHEGFDDPNTAGAFPNDIALLRLASHSFDLESKKIPIASGDELFIDQTCQISGWGNTESGGAPSTLLKANVRVLSLDECRTAWEDTDGTYVVGQHICVIGEETADGAGSCNGDSGGPLTCGGKLAGVTSWGRSGCHTNGVVEYPSVYARTTFFYDWIKAKCNCL